MGAVMTMMTAVTYVNGDGRLQCVPTFRPEISRAHLTGQSLKRKINTWWRCQMYAAQTSDFV